MLAMVVGLVISISVLSGKTGATDLYYTRYDDATGLKYGTQVLYMGFPVGQVEAIRPVVTVTVLGSYSSPSATPGSVGNKTDPNVPARAKSAVMILNS